MDEPNADTGFGELGAELIWLVGTEFEFDAFAGSKLVKRFVRHSQRQTPSRQQPHEFDRLANVIAAEENRNGWESGSASGPFLCCVPLSERLPE
jgi:hypothetical protein